MSASPVSDAIPSPTEIQPKNNGNYKGFVAGVASGIAKLSVG
jgi:hypothetical protein